MEYLTTVFTNPQILGDLSDIPGDILEIVTEIISERSLGISGHVEISETGREILQKCPSRFINPRLKVGTARGDPGDSGEFLAEEIF